MSKVVYIPLQVVVHWEAILDIHLKGYWLSVFEFCKSKFHDVTGSIFARLYKKL